VARVATRHRAAHLNHFRGEEITRGFMRLHPFACGATESAEPTRIPHHECREHGTPKGVIVLVDGDIAMRGEGNRPVGCRTDTPGSDQSVDSSDVVLNNGGMTATATFSDLLRTPNEVISKLESDGSVLLTRRDAQSLRLSFAAPAAAEAGTLAALAQLIGASLDDEMCDRIASHLIEPFPWIDFLPAQARREFVGEFLRTTRACAAVSRFDRLTIVLAAWQGTAEAYADPAIAIDGSDLDYLPSKATVEVPDPRDLA
jgi:hypothetical protein